MNEEEEHQAVYQLVGIFKTNEYKRLFISIGYLLVSIGFTLATLVIVDYMRPVGYILPDIIQNNVPVFDFIDVINVLIAVSVAVESILVIVFQRWTVVLRRVFVIYGTLLLLRNITMVSTLLPDPHAKCASKSQDGDHINITKSLKMIFKGTTCGDLIFSGHELGLLIPALVHSHYFSDRLSIMFYLIAVCGAFLIVISRMHYSIDVIISIIVCLSLFWWYTAMAECPQLADYCPGIVRKYFEAMEWGDEVNSTVDLSTDGKV